MSAIIPIRFIIKPARINWMLLKLPLAKAMVLGAVAITNIKPNDAENVAGNISLSGLIPSAMLSEANMGSISVIVATLDATSLRSVIITQSATAKQQYYMKRQFFNIVPFQYVFSFFRSWDYK